MGLTTGQKSGDMSGCVEATIGFFGYNRFDSGKMGISWDYTGGSDERIFGKDPTMNLNDQTSLNNALYLDYIQMSCSTGGPVTLLDGSAGVPVVALACGDTSGGSTNSAFWDFRKDPLICLTADSTESLCVSSAVNGYVAGYVKCHWGPPPTNR